MAHRNRRRTRPRHQTHHDQTTSAASSVASSWPGIATRSSANHWQVQWDLWQSRRQFTTLSPLQSRGQAQASMESNMDMMKHRIHLFGGEECDGSDLCGPMLQVVMNLFDGGLDYADP